MGVSDALNLVTDPDSEATKARLAQLEAENERLRTTRPNGVSPAATTPSVGAEGPVSSMKMSEYLAIIQQGGPRARELMQAVGSNRTKLDTSQ
jgi:hypothetical protein